MTRKHTIASFSAALLRLRDWERSNFPNRGHRITFDIVISVASHESSSKKLTLKELQSMLPYSPRTIKYEVSRLIEEGWFQLERSLSDRRSKYVSVSLKLKKLLLIYKENFYSE